MNWISKLERKFGNLAIPNLMFYIIVLYIVGFILDLVTPGFYGQWLCLDMGAILQGQVWRLVTFLIQPPSASPLFMVFALYLYYMIGKVLELIWGSFRFNLYFFMGVIFQVIAALLVYLLFHISWPLGTSYINLSLFFAYAAVYPDQQFYLFFFIPVKVKWLAWLDAAFFGYTILQAFLPSYGGGPYGFIYRANALAAFVAILNFIVFYLSSRNMRKYSPKEVRRRKTYQRQVKVARQEKTYANGARHRCAVCGRTELDDPNLEFRYCSKCNGNYEYCQDHLFTHEHVK